MAGIPHDQYEPKTSGQKWLNRLKWQNWLKRQNWLKMAKMATLAEKLGKKVKIAIMATAG